MSRLITDRLHTNFLPGVAAQDPIVPRRYTLTHSDYTGELFLTIGLEYNTAQLTGSIAKFMRDEVLAEWQVDNPYALHLFCHVSGGWVLGTASIRYKIFQWELPLALEALRYGDRRLFTFYPYLDEAPVFVHFSSMDPRFNKIEAWGNPRDYNIRGLRRTAVVR